MPGTRDRDDPHERLRILLDRLGPDWDEMRVEHAPTDEDTVADVLEWLPVTVEEPETYRPQRLRPSGGWGRYLLPLVGVGLIVFALITMGAIMVDPFTGSLLIAGGILLVILSLLNRGRHVDEKRRARRVEEVLLYYDLEPSARREAFRQQVELVREAKRALRAARREQE